MVFQTKFINHLYQIVRTKIVSQGIVSTIMTLYCRIYRNLLLGRIISSKESQKYYSLCTVLDIFSIQDFKKARRHVQCELILIFCEENPPSTESSSTMPRIKPSTRGPWDGKASRDVSRPGSFSGVPGRLRTPTIPLKAKISRNGWDHLRFNL